MKSQFCLLLAFLLPSISGWAGEARGGTGGHGADVVFCQDWNEFISSPRGSTWRQQREIGPNNLRGVFIWDWIQMGAPALARTEGQSSEFYVNRVQEILKARLPQLAARFQRFKDSVGREDTAVDEDGIARSWVRVQALLGITPPPQVVALPPNCDGSGAFSDSFAGMDRPTRVISRMKTGTSVALYHYEGALLEKLKKQSDPQYSMVLTHEFLRDDRSDDDASIWAANVLLHSPRVERMSSQQLKNALIALGVSTGDSAYDREEEARIVERRKAYYLALKPLNTEVDQVSKRLFAAERRGAEALRAEACSLKDTLKASLVNFFERAPSALNSPLEARLSSQDGALVALNAWNSVSQGCEVQSVNTGLPPILPILPGTGLPGLEVGTPQSLPGFGMETLPARDFSTMPPAQALQATTLDSPAHRQACERYVISMTSKIRSLLGSSTWDGSAAAASYSFYLEQCVFPKGLLEFSETRPLIHPIEFPGWTLGIQSYPAPLSN